jgi:hypothetical protein
MQPELFAKMKINLHQMKLDSYIEIKNCKWVSKLPLTGKYSELAERVEKLSIMLRDEIQKEEDKKIRQKKALDLFTSAVCS